MPLRPITLLVPLLGILLAFLSPVQMPDMAKTRRGRGGGGPAAVQSPYGAWGSAFQLKKRMAKAQEWAKESLRSRRSGLPSFVIEPTAIVSSPEIVSDVLRADWAPAMTILGATDNAAKTKMAAAMASYVIAVYAPETGVIHIVPENAHRAAAAVGKPELMSENVLRLLLARMCVLALDRQNIPEAKKAIDAATSLDALQIAGAVLQGHVQSQTRRIATYWSQDDSSFPVGTFDELATLLTAPVSEQAPPALRAFAAGVKFAIVDGEAFMSQMPRARHPVIMANPPKKRQVIFDPKAYLAELRGSGSKGPTDLHTRVQKEFVEAVLTEGAWNQTETELASDAAKAMLDPLPSSYSSMAIAAYKGGQRIRNELGEPDATGKPIVDIYVFQFSKAGPAESFVSLLRGAAKQRGGTLGDGAGRDDNLAGFHGTEIVGDDKQTWTMQWASEGRFVVGFQTTAVLEKAEDRDPYDDAMEAAAEVLSKVTKTRDSRRKRRGR